MIIVSAITKPSQWTVAFTIVLFILALEATASADLPNPRLTPGAISESRIVVICQAGATRHRRIVSRRLRRDVFIEYHIAPQQRNRYTLDHLIPLELGGANNIRNLWPQLRSDAKKKDRVENRLHNMVCRGVLPLARAQMRIAKDWTTAVTTGL